METLIDTLIPIFLQKSNEFSNSENKILRIEFFSEDDINSIGVDIRIKGESLEEKINNGLVDFIEGMLEVLTEWPEIYDYPSMELTLYKLD